MKLIYSDSIIKSYTDDLMYGDGIVEIGLTTQDFVVLNEDESVFEKFSFLEDQYKVENGTNELIARKFIPNQDFFSLFFDCKTISEQDEFVIIYINNSSKKIEKNKYSINFKTWDEYIKEQYVKIKSDNLLTENTEYGKRFVKDSTKHIYAVKEINREELKLVTTSTGCCKASEKIEGIVKWRENNKLLVDICVID